MSSITSALSDMSILEESPLSSPTDTEYHGRRRNSLPPCLADRILSFGNSTTTAFKSPMKSLYIYFYRLQTKLREDNVFTPVSDSIHRGGSVQGGLFQERVSSVEGTKTSRGSLCPGGSLSKGESLSRGALSGRPPHTVKIGQYASYWNAFLFPVPFHHRHRSGTG